MNKSILTFAAALLAGSALVPAAMNAADFPQAVAFAQSSLAKGLAQNAVPLLQRSSAISGSSVSDALIENFCAAPCTNASKTQLTDAVAINGDHWTMQVSNDGTAGRFTDTDVSARAHSLGKDVSLRLSQAALEQAGRTFVASKLSSVITLAANEQLVPLSTSYRVEGGQDVRTGETTESVVASRVVFGRAINGIPVVGGGSQVAVTFANDGSVESFRYDWPRYTASATQSVVDNVEIFNRLRQALGARTNGPVMKFSAAFSGLGGTYPFALSADTTLQKLECGYYDSGAASRDGSAPVQAGCVYHAVMQGPQGMRRGFAGAVPAGSTILADKNWAEAQLLLGSSNGPASIVPATASDH